MVLFRLYKKQVACETVFVQQVFKKKKKLPSRLATDNIMDFMNELFVEVTWEGQGINCFLIMFYTI